MLTVQSGIYVLSASMALAGTSAFVVFLRKTQFPGIGIATIAAVAFGILFMVKARCLGGQYPCGFMSFQGGFTWQILPGIAIMFGGLALLAVLLGYIKHVRFPKALHITGKSAAPLVGLWLVVLWEILPIHIIHPASHGGICPSIPIICHDMPLFSMGGLFWWPLPFLSWAVILFWRDV